MNLTLKELKELLSQQYDPESLVDLLGVSSEQIVEAFSDVIEDNYNKIIKEVEFDY